MPSSSRRVHGFLVWVLSPLLFAYVAVLLGKDAGWDFQNYHWYNPYALFNGRLGVDLAVAHHATYYNPLLDVPLYVIAQMKPAWLAGAMLGALYGVVVGVLGAIAYRIFSRAEPHWRWTLAIAIALLGAAGGGAFHLIGSTSNDVPAVIGLFAALWIVINHFDELQQLTISPREWRWLLLAGLCAGASVGLKLTTATYALGLASALVCVSRSWRQRAGCAVWFGGGLFGGTALCAGYWMARMWSFGRNPLFPYFNQVFHSPLLTADSYRDSSYFPDDALTAWLFPFYFTADSHWVAEWEFRDARILVAYLLVPITLLLMLCKRHRRDGWVEPRLAVFLFMFAAVSYVAWLMLFCVYRYVVPLEMLCPLLITCAVMLWPLRQRVMVAALSALLVICQVTVKVNLERQPWGPAYVQVEPPQLPDAAHSAILMAGLAPMAFVIPFFPRAVPFWRIDGWLVHMDDHRSGLARELHRRVAAHPGPLYILFASYDRVNAINAAREYGLAFVPATCAAVPSNITASLYLCQLTRATSAAQTPSAAWPHS